MSEVCQATRCVITLSRVSLHESYIGSYKGMMKRARERRRLGGTEEDGGGKEEEGRRKGGEGERNRIFSASSGGRGQA